MKKIIRGLSVFALLMFVGSSFAQGDMPAPPPGPGFAEGGEMPPMMPGMAKMLELSEEQVNKMTDYRLQLKKEILPLQSKVLEQGNELKLLITAENPDLSKINKAIDGISKIRTEIQHKRVNHLLKVRSQLTDVQKKKFDVMILSGRKGMHHPHGKMGASFYGHKRQRMLR